MNEWTSERSNDRSNPTDWLNGMAWWNEWKNERKNERTKECNGRMIDRTKERTIERMTERTNERTNERTKEQTIALFSDRNKCEKWRKCDEISNFLRPLMLNQLRCELLWWFKSFTFLGHSNFSKFSNSH